VEVLHRKQKKKRTWQKGNSLHPRSKKKGRKKENPRMEGCPLGKRPFWGGGGGGVVFGGGGGGLVVVFLGGRGFGGGGGGGGVLLEMVRANNAKKRCKQMYRMPRELRRGKHS